MSTHRPFSDLSVTELQKVLGIKEQIAALESQFTALITGAPAPKSSTTPTGKRRGRPPGSKSKSAKPAKTAKPAPAKSPSTTTKPKRKLSPEARARIAAAQRARWAASRK